MRAVSTFKIALSALRRNKMRSALTALGIIIGVGAVITMVSIGNGAKAQVEAQIATLGQNVITIYSGSFSSGGVHGGSGSAGTLKLEDAEAIKREIPEVALLSPQVRNTCQVVAGNQNWSTYVRGEGADYLDLREWPLAEGATFTDQDVRNANKVCVLGRTVATQLFNDESPLGKIIRISEVPFVITGVLTKKGFSFTGQDQDDAIIMPYTSAMKRVFGGTTLRSITLKTRRAADLEPVQQRVTLLLRQRHNIRQGKDDDFMVRTLDELTETATQTARVMTGLLGSIAGVSLLVGGIGIMNIMLVSVTERTREIGIRMAVGAHGRDILLQFLIEAIALSSMGGAIGVLGGISFAKLLSIVKGWPAVISLTSVAAAFLFSAAVGIFFGFYPARKASQLDPIDALRYE